MLPNTIGCVSVDVRLLLNAVVLAHLVVHVHSYDLLLSSVDLLLHIVLVHIVGF